jgi:hypothetical protein
MIADPKLLALSMRFDPGAQASRWFRLPPSYSGPLRWVIRRRSGSDLSPRLVDLVASSRRPAQACAVVSRSRAASARLREHR